jgi:4-amino-L-phenylalanyl-[CmlP-peptidyl-carrier-protein] 3-hydroxylase
VTLSLRSNVIAEPAIAGWYAWSYLLPPHTLAKYLQNHYQGIVESYLARPQTHRTALKQARFQGGPFIREQAGSEQMVGQWYEAARERYAPLLELAGAIDELEKIVSAQTGASMDQVYRELPEPLAGRVELFYSRDNHTADYRFIEPLLYASPYFDRGLQQVRFSDIHQDAREFALTTPVLEYTPDQLLLTVPLDSELLDTVFRGGLTPEELGRITADLGLAGERARRFREFFTEDQEPAAGREPSAASAADVIEYAGHACVFVRNRGVSFLVDPVLSYSGYARDARARFTFSDLPDRIDYVLITHNHQDHMLLETLLKIRHRVGRVLIAKSASSSLVDPDLKLILEKLGYHDVTEVSDLESLDTPGGTITAVPFLGEHGDVRIRTKSGWLLDLDGTRVLFAADSTNVSPHLYPQVASAVGQVDMVFIGMESVGAPASWVYGALFPERLDRGLDAGRRLKGSDFEQALAIVDAMGAREVYVYAMGQEPWLGAVMCVEYDEKHPAITDSDKLVASVTDRGGTARRLYLHETIALTRKSGG